MDLRLGLVGRGQWGRKIERTLVSFPGVSVTTILKGKRPPAGIDGVLISTQSANHAEAALPYIEAGIATFIEKPMTTSLADAERIGIAAKRSGAPVFVGHIFLYNPAFIAGLKLLPTLGPIRYLLCEGFSSSPRTDSSVLWDWLPHDLSIACKIFGRDPDRVAAWSLLGGLCPAAAVSKFEFGAIPIVSTISWFAPTRRKLVTVACEDGTLIFDDKAPQRLKLHGKTGQVSYPGYSDEPPLTRELGAFLQTVRSRLADFSHIEMGTSIVRAIAAAEESISMGGKSVTIKETGGRYMPASI